MKLVFDQNIHTHENNFSNEVRCIDFTPNRFVATTSVDDLYNKHYHRWQIPLAPAFACTTHKMQGATAKHGAVIEPSANKPFARGLDYVAASRPTELHKLILLSPLTEVHFNSFPQERHSIRQEYDRLKKLHPIIYVIN